MCEYTEHGHCGILENGEVDNDATLALLARVSVSHAGAGADMIAPSDMMDGRVAAIRSALDADGFSHTPILSYAAKYASAYYGPFREAAESVPKSGDRKGYQMDPGNASEALREVFADIEEGADAVTLAESALTIALSIFNTSPESFSFTSALHNYFFVADVRESHIEGLRGTQYLDKTEGFIEKMATADKVVIDRETDRIYRNVREQVMLHDHASGTALDIAATGFPDIVVWNPWEQGARQFADMPEDDYLRMVCIEAALAATQFTLASGERWTGAQQLIVRGT
jgi:Delta-aminolevulinic acid dehydratase/Aldose 1-epimerase